MHKKTKCKTKSRTKTKNTNNSKPKTKYYTVGRFKKKDRAELMAKSYGKGYKTKIVHQKSGYALKLLGPV